MTVLLILTALMWSRSTGNAERSRQLRCQDNLQKCHIALQIFATDHAGKLPEVSGAKSSEEPLSLLVPRYTVDTSLFICPATADKALPSGEAFATRKISYAYYMGSSLTDPATVLLTDRQVDGKDKSPGQPVFSATGKPPGNNHHKSGGNILFADGRVEFSPARSTVSLVATNGVVLLNPKF